MTWILDNANWLFSGLGVTVLMGILSYVWKSRSTSSEADSNSAQVTINNNYSPSIGGGVNITEKISQEATQTKERDQVSILFIDDQKFDYVKILKGAGYANTKRISDIKSIDCIEVYQSDIIFVDINGVGKVLFPNEQGFGVAKAIKNKYGEDKCVIIYSASHQPLNKEFLIFDGVLNKNAEPYEFINLIENWRNK